MNKLQDYNLSADKGGFNFLNSFPLQNIHTPFLMNRLLPGHLPFQIAFPAVVLAMATDPAPKLNFVLNQASSEGT